MSDKHEGARVSDLNKEYGGEVAGASEYLVEIENSEYSSFLPCEFLELLLLHVIDASHLEDILVGDDVFKPGWWVREVTFFLLLGYLGLTLFPYDVILFGRTRVRHFIKDLFENFILLFFLGFLVKDLTFTDSICSEH